MTGGMQDVCQEQVPIIEKIEKGTPVAVLVSGGVQSSRNDRCLGVRSPED